MFDFRLPARDLRSARARPGGVIVLRIGKSKQSSRSKIANQKSGGRHAVMPGEPFMRAPTNLSTVISPLANSAPGTADISDPHPCLFKRLRADYAAKTGANQRGAFRPGRGALPAPGKGRRAQALALARRRTRPRRR